MNKISLLFAAVMAAGLAAATLPANAGGHEWWRSCGGHAYEGCDGIRRGPYAHSGSYGAYRPRRQPVCTYYRTITRTPYGIRVHTHRHCG